MKEKSVTRISCPMKICQKWNKIQTFSGIRKVRKCVTSKPTLLKNVKGSTGDEGKWDQMEIRPIQANKEQQKR